MSIKESGIYIHEEWKGMTQPVGLVVEPIVLDRFGIYPERNINILSDLQRRLEGLLIENEDSEKSVFEVKSFKEFCQEVLDWQEGDLISSKDFHSKQSKKVISVSLEDYEETLKPDWIVPYPNINDSEIEAQILVKELPIGTSFDHVPKNNTDKRQWEATPQQRFERLLKESEQPVGILWNGVALRLIYAPRGESSGYLTFPLEPMTFVDGRPMIGALEMLLGPDRLFEGGSSDTRLKILMEKSRKEQNEVSTRLAEQVLEALWILVRGFDQAEMQAKQNGRTILGDLSIRDPSHIYGGLITVLLRLVFLLYAEGEELMPKDSTYGQHYSVSGLALRLRQDRRDYQGAMDGRRGAWTSLLSLFRLIYDGGGPYPEYLPARHGELFDPEAYPFLEGRSQDSSYENAIIETIPAISDDVVEKILTKLLILDGQILSYRALDVEQIGSVYEAIMGFNVELTKASSVGICYRPPRQNITITFVVDADELLSQRPEKRETWLKNHASTDLNLSTKTKQMIKQAENLSELCSALGNRLSVHTPRGLTKGNLILQPTPERRRSGSHYTPRSLTEPLTLEAFRPWLTSCNYSPSADEILNMKICDPAMGSGAFLVSACRFLANHLVKAWERDGFPDGFDESFDKDIYARRIVAQNCLYGVDKNPFAVNLSKLSLWLVTLSKNLPFTFVDHSLKCGDSLIGCSLKDIQTATKELQLNFFDKFSNRDLVINKLGAERLDNFSSDNRNDQAYENKKFFLKKFLVATEELRLTGDLIIASFFDEANNKERNDKKNYYLSQLSMALKDEALLQKIKDIPIQLAKGSKAIKPFHWELEFPEVFNLNREGFDIFIGNPPFAGSVLISQSNKTFYPDYLRISYPGTGGQCDLSAYFFRRGHELIKSGGTINFIATNTISQGGTRTSGLAFILANKGLIFNAIKKARWPGVASVIISIVHIIKSNQTNIVPILNNYKVKRISAYLTDGDIDNDPYPIIGNRNKIMSAMGKMPNGKGFIFSTKTGKGFIPLDKKNELLSKNKKYNDVVKEYLGGNELNNSPSLRSDRYILDFGSRNYNQSLHYEEAIEILRKTVHPFSKRSDWWLFQNRAIEVNQRIKELDLKRVIVMAETSNTFAAAFTNTENVCCAKTIIIFTDDTYSAFLIIQSRLHEYWSRMVSCTLKDDFRYVPSICFDSFPFPKGWDSDKELESLGENFYNSRSHYLRSHNIGLTKFYNLINDSKCRNEGIVNMRKQIDQIDKKILQMYGFENFDTEVDFHIKETIIDLEKNTPLANEEVSEQNSKLYYGWSNQAREKILSNLMALNFNSHRKESQDTKSKSNLKSSSSSLNSRKDQIEIIFE